MRGILISPVSDNIGKYELMSWFSYGVNVIVMVVDKPALILPVGVYWIWKKSLILSSSGKSLNELNENETLVKRIVWVCDAPTVKSYSCHNVICYCVTYLKFNDLRLRNERSSLELSSCHNLWFDHSFFLPYKSFCHILLFKCRKLRNIWLSSNLIYNLLLSGFLRLSQFKLMRC